MTSPFGPRLIGETEKTLNAILRHHLADHDLAEPQWVTLQLADAHAGTVDTEGLAAAVRDRAHFADAPDLVASLTARGLLADGHLTPTAAALVATIRQRIAATTAGIWEGLPESDVAATTRVLNEVLARGREAVSALDR